MAIKLKDRVKTGFSTVGVGAIIFGDTRDNFQSWDAIPNGDTTYYCITTKDDWEVGYGVKAATQLSRNLIASSTGSKIYLEGAGDVFCTYPGDLAVVTDPNGDLTIEGDVFADNLYTKTQIDAQNEAQDDRIDQNEQDINTNANEFNNYMPKSGGTFTGVVKFHEDIETRGTLADPTLDIKFRPPLNPDGTDNTDEYFGLNFNIDHANTHKNRFIISNRTGTPFEIRGGGNPAGFYRGAITESDHMVNKNYVDSQINAIPEGIFKDVDGNAVLTNDEETLTIDANVGELGAKSRISTSTSVLEFNIGGGSLPDMQVNSAGRVDIADSLFVKGVEVGAAGNVPIGAITLWMGTTAPSGWAICNGTNGTPDMRGLLPIGQNGSYALNSTGGSANAIAVSHTHTASSNSTGAHTHSTTAAGNHAHSYSSSTNSSTVSSASGGIGTTSVLSGNTTVNTNTTGNHSHTANSAGNHSHTITVNSGGSSGTGKNLPPYRAVNYIMRIS